MRSKLLSLDNSTTAFLLLAVVLAVGPTASGQEPPREASPRSAVNRRTEEMVGFLELGVRQSNLQLDDLEERIPKLETRLEQLMAEVEEIGKPKKRESPPPEPEPAREIRYRPPLEQRTGQQTLLFCCHEGELKFVDQDSIARQLAERSRRPDAKPVVLRPGPRGSGETEEAIQQPRSRFKRTLTARQPGSWCVNFAVWPDSYDIYRTARSIAWDSGFDVGWHPLDVGEEPTVGRGQGIVD